MREQHGLHERRCAVVDGRVGDIHAVEFADHRLELVDGLERALADLRLVRSVRCVKLGALEYGVYRGRDEVVVDARAEETHGVIPNPVGLPTEQPHGLRLGQARRKVQSARFAHGGRYGCDEIVEGSNTNGGKHLREVVIGVRDEMVGS